MPNELDSRLAERIASSAMYSLRTTSGGKILCTKEMLKRALLGAVSEGYTIGFLAGQKEQVCPTMSPGSPDGPAWMDIRLDDPPALAQHSIRLRPIVLRSLIQAGYTRLGDLRWVPRQELTGLYYIGYKAAGQIRGIVRRFEQDPESTKSPPEDPASPGAL